MTRLFFYGTLMSREERGHVLRGCARLVGEATITGDLFNVGCFPAYVPHPPASGCADHPEWNPNTACRWCREVRREQLTAERRRVVGQVWEVLPGCERHALALTDRIEGYREGDPRSMYVRELVEATLAGGETIQVETYRWNGSTLGMERIVGGSWRAFTGANDLATAGIEGS